jgi:Uma2 family endonuclease
MQCRIQAPIILSDHSEPEPDLALVRRRADNYRAEHPTSDDIFLVIEVAQSSRHRDLELKRRIYAASGIGEYWVIDVDEQLIVVHREASEADYQVVTPLNSGAVSPLAASACEIDVRWLFD